MFRIARIARAAAVVVGALGCSSGAGSFEDLASGENAAKQNWAVEAVPIEAGITVTEVSVAVDSDGRVHALAQLVSTEYASDQKLVYAVRETSGWRVRDLAAGLHTSVKIAVDPWDAVHAAYVWRQPGDDSGTSVAKYVRLDGAQPVYEDIPREAASTTAQPPYQAVDFAIDELGRVHVVGTRSDSKLGIAYALRIAEGKWVGPMDPLTMLDTAPTPGEPMPDLSRGFRAAHKIGVTSTTVPSLLVMAKAQFEGEATPTVLRFRGEYGWYPEPSWPLSGNHSAFSLDQNGDRHILADHDLDYSYARRMRTQPEESARLILKGPPADIGPALALATDEEDVAHIAVVGVEGKLQYGRFVDGDFPKQGMSSIPLVTRTWQRSVAIAVDGVRPHLLVSDNADAASRLKYLTVR